MNQPLMDKIQTEAKGLDIKLHGVAGKMDEAVDAGKVKLAGIMERGSEQLLSGALAVEEGAMGMAGKLGDGAQYLREGRPSRILSDCRWFMKKYPVQSLVAGVVAGLLVGRSIWSRSNSTSKDLS